ncbi:hypothetical protein JTE90_026499 [Oedothorax gibbosus]|uniref:BTB domain-containing protein n=1 Tax=Oedothorax gibbosus TaxID=931172 RepID=A0AAV6VRZ3_9ARAC|nr:hypothetical protein JTE90_026499 [Oedothorax gibbosus]
MIAAIKRIFSFLSSQLLHITENFFNSATENLSMDTIYMKSQILDHSRRFEWSVVKFSKFPAMSTIISKEFKLTSGCPFKFIIEIGVSTETFKLFIRRTDKIEYIFPVSGEISFHNSEGQNVEKILDSVYVFDNIGDKPEKTEIWSSARPGHSTLQAGSFPFKLPDDELTIKCHIVVSNCCIVTEQLEGSRRSRTVPQDMSDFLEDLETMYFDKPLTDILLKVSGEYIPCHKFILSARSPVLRKILEEDSNVKKFGIIPIKDMDLMVMDDFLEYIYTNSFRGSSVEALIGLYEVAIKYRMTGLQEKCSDLLSKNLTENTVCRTLILADDNSDAKLREACSVFITEHFYNLKNMNEFEAFVENNPRLFFQIICHSYGEVLPISKQ